MVDMDVDQFIKYVQDERLLWDQKHSNHHNRYVLDKTWEVVAKKMGVGRKTVQSKWKYLRDTFRREYMKRSKQSAEDRDPDWPKWRYYSSMLFIADQFSSKDGDGRVNSPHFAECIKEEYSVPSGLGGSYSILPEEDSEYAEAMSPVSNGMDSPVSQAEKRQAQYPMEKILGMEAKKLKYLKAEREDDEDDLFFKSMTKEVKKLPEMQKLRVKMEIHEIIYKARMEHQESLNK